MGLFSVAYFPDSSSQSVQVCIRRIYLSFPFGCHVQRGLLKCSLARLLFGPRKTLLKSVAYKFIILHVHTIHIEDKSE